MRALVSCTSLSLVMLLAACDNGTPWLPPDATLPDGSHYHGKIVDGLLQGSGRLEYRNGDWFEGNFKDGLFDGQGEWQSADGEHYTGTFRKGEFSGNGHIERRDGSIYTGGFRNGQYSGLGKLEEADGSSYLGNFSNGLAEGQGVRSEVDGTQLTGTFKAGKLTGLGTLKTSEGDLYSGQFEDGMFAGQGRFSNSLGDTWSGQFTDNSLNGLGRYKGTDGAEYSGEFKDWQFHGQGELHLADGRQYKGSFRYGEYAGNGTLTEKNGSQQKGYWQNGQRVRDAAGKPLPDPLEIGLLKQGKLLDSALANVPPSTPAIELYTLVLAGDGSQSVFMREADYVTDLLKQRFAARGQIELVNHRDHLADRPLATRENLRLAVETLAKRSGPEDLLFIYMTSHGSRSHRLSLEQPRIELRDLSANELATILKPLKQRNKVVVISACYSGGFITPLQDQSTLIMTAARKDRVSFGCSDDNDFTYFGRALFANALNQTDDLERAFELAKSEVSQREKEDNFDPSEPQIAPAKAVTRQWHKMRAIQAERALNSPTEAAAKSVKH